MGEVLCTSFPFFLFQALPTLRLMAVIEGSTKIDFPLNTGLHCAWSGSLPTVREHVFCIWDLMALDVDPCSARIPSYIRFVPQALSLLISANLFTELLADILSTKPRGCWACLAFCITLWAKDFIVQALWLLS